MTSHVTQRPAANGAAMTAPGPFSMEYRAPTTRRSVAAQVTTMLAMLAGLWVAISPWFLVLQAPAAGNATALDVIIGLTVAALGLFAISGARGFMGLQVASGLLGIWLIIAPFILTTKLGITAAMYWSNVWAGGIIVVLSLASLATLRRVGVS